MRILLVILLCSLPVLADEPHPVLNWNNPAVETTQQVRSWQQHEAAWRALDTDGDGQLTATEEQAAGINAWGGSTVEFDPYARSKEATAQLNHSGPAWQGFGQVPMTAP